MTKDISKFWSANEAAYRLGVSKTWLLKMAHEGRITPEPTKLNLNKFRGIWLFDRESKIISKNN
jgi:hypothetical protein